MRMARPVHAREPGAQTARGRVARATRKDGDRTPDGGIVQDFIVDLGGGGQDQGQSQGGELHVLGERQQVGNQDQRLASFSSAARLAAYLVSQWAAHFSAGWRRAAKQWVNS